MGAAGPPWVLASDGGLRAVVVAGGAPASMSVGEVELVQHPASPFEPGLLQVWLRDRAADHAWPLLGAGSSGVVRVRKDALVVTGREDGALAWQVTLRLHADRPAWAWHVEVRNEGAGSRELDLVHTHDVALSLPGALRANELYVSQYLDIRPLRTTTGTALAVRQNLPQAGRHPWCVLTASRPVAAWSTDALDVVGLTARSARTGPVGDLPSRRRQHEHTLAALQTERVHLDGGGRYQVSFASLLVPDHPEATSDADLPAAAEALALARGADGAPPHDDAAPGHPAPRSVYAVAIRTRSLDEDELRRRWPGRWRATQRAVEADDAVLSFFTDDDEHVVTQPAELVTLRPHGTILRTGATARPDPSSLTVTAWMTGSPLSYLTSGHASDGRVLTTVRGYLGLHRAYGIRVLVDVDGHWRLLDLPSTFAMTPDAARWVYAFEDRTGTVEIATTAPPDEHRVRLEVRTTTGPPRRFLAALHLATQEDPLPAGQAVEVGRGGDAVVLRVPRRDGELALRLVAHTPVQVGDGSELFTDGRPQETATVTLRSDGDMVLDLTVDDVRHPPAPSTTEPITTDHVGDRSAWWPRMTELRVAGVDAAEPLAVTLPWLVRDALVHHLAPRGLEQYTGGAWGTRDVTQGPLELLIALDRRGDARALLLTVFAAQNTDGTWPQAFGFLPGDEHFRHEPPHGDIVHWPVLAVGRYLLAWADASVLAEPVPWYTRPGDTSAEPTPLADHLQRALADARAGSLPGTRLVAYGHGDWNDSLQPADPAMAATMASAWTVTLHHQAMSTLGDGLEAAGALPDLVAELRAEATAVAADLRRYLLADGELAGYVQVDPDGARTAAGPSTRLLVHPRDHQTGLHHGSLQMIHALGADLLGPQEAAHHVDLVRKHLMGVDGVRLFDRPPAYRGGTMTHFQRAETAAFVGREIGLMYVHAHLRWCEAMARWGDPDALWLGLLQVLPTAADHVVPGARPRQANTYPSSSDAACLHREDFAARYHDVLEGRIGLEAGWRVYSSGPGVLVRVVAQSLLGIRRRADAVEVDPVLPAALDALRAEVPLDGGVLRVRYRVGPRGYGPVAVRLGGADLATTPSAPNPYRPGGVRVALADLRPGLAAEGPELEVQLP